MTRKRFDDLILEVFETSPDFFYFPIVSQRQAKEFVRALHGKGLEYDKIGHEIQETDEKFSTWRKGLSCSKVGQRLIQRINRPMVELLEGGSRDVPDDFESLFEVEPDFFLIEKQIIKKNSKLWRFLRCGNDTKSSEKLSRSCPECVSEDSMESQFVSDANVTEPSIDQANSLVTIISDAPLERTPSPEFVGIDIQDDEPTDSHGQAEACTNEPNETLYETALEDQSIYYEAHTDCMPAENYPKNIDDYQSHTLKDEEVRVRSLSELSSCEDQFCDCDSFKSCSSTCVEDPIPMPRRTGPRVSMRDENRVKAPPDYNSEDSPTQEDEVGSLHEIESYNSDIDSSCYDVAPLCMQEINKEIKKLSGSRNGPGFLYVFSDNRLLPDTLFKVGTSRNPEKKLLQASSFNTKLTLIMKFRVANMHLTLMTALERMSKWKVDGHVDWFQGNQEECFRVLEDIRYDESLRSCLNEDQNYTF